MRSVCRLSLAERKAWALRRGNPLWLWPEVAPEEWKAALFQIEQACVAVLGGSRAFELSGDPVPLGLAGYTSGMGPMLGHWLREGRIAAATQAIERLFLDQLQANSARMETLLSQAKTVISEFSQQGIGVAVLKGAHTASVYFPVPGCRPMSDIDLLVSPEQSTAAAGLLRELRYRRTAMSRRESTWKLAGVADEPRSFLSVESDDPWSIDLHESLDIGGPPGAATARLSQAVGCSARRHFARQAWQLTQPLLMLHLAAHSGSGFHNLTLVRLLELVLVARTDRANGSLSWDEFLEAGSSTGALPFAFPALAMALRLSPRDIPEAVVDQCARAAPARIRRLVGGMRPATAHRIAAPSLGEHFAWTSGALGWLQRLAADLVPEPRSLRMTAAIHASRARGLLNGSRSG